MTIRMIKSVTLVTVMCVFTLVMVAASGGKGKKKAGATAKVTYTTKVNLSKISLRTNYEFKGGKLFTVPTSRDVRIINNYTTIKTGGKTVVVASKHTLAKPVISLDNNSGSVSVKVARISLN